MTAKYESFIEAVKASKSLAVVDKDNELFVIVRGFDEPFFSIRKSDRAISFVPENFKAPQLDFSQFLFALGTLFMQGDPTDFMKNVPLIDNSKNTDDVLAVIKKDGTVVASDAEGISTDDLSLVVIKWLMKLFSDESTDPILGLVGLARMVEGKWDYSLKEQEAVSSNENSEEKHDVIGTAGGEEESV
jgi:hypothetical protein